jgi:DNA-directed RNA polymerase specialized sigma24 family protein
MFNRKDHDLAKFVIAQEKECIKFFGELPEAATDDEHEILLWLYETNATFDLNLAERAVMIWRRFGFDPGAISDAKPFTMKGFTAGKPTQDVLDAHPTFHKDLIAAISEYQEINARYQIFQVMCRATRGTAVQQYNAIRAKWIEFASSVWNEGTYWYMRIYGAADLFPSMINSNATLKPFLSGGNSLRDTLQQYQQETGSTLSPHGLLCQFLPSYTEHAVQNRKSGESLRKLQSRTLSKIEKDLQPYQPEENVESYDARLSADGDAHADLLPADFNNNPEARLMASCEMEALMEILVRVLKSDIQRTVYLHSEVNGLKDQETAALMNTTVGAVKAALHKARKNMEKFRAA